MTIRRKTIRGSGLLATSHGFHAAIKIGHPLLRSLAADAYICIMVWIHCWVPPHGRTWQRSGHWKRAPPRVVFSSLYKFPRDHCPWLLSREAKKEGCDSPVLARLILLLRSPVSCVWRLVRLSVAAQAEISETPGPSATGGTKDGVCRRPWYACQGGSLGVSTC